MTLNGGSLKYVPNRIYEILVQTLYMHTYYTQKVQISIENVVELPVISLE